MNKTISIIIVVVLVALGSYWYMTMDQGALNSGNTTGNTENTNEAESTNSTSENNGPINVKKNANGEYLTDRNGFTLYVNVRDESQSGTIKAIGCNSACETTWIPYLLEPNEAAIDRTTDPVLSKINLFTRTDGKIQYALGTKPLYKHVNDKAPGNIFTVSGDWMVAKP